MTLKIVLLGTWSYLEQLPYISTRRNIVISTKSEIKRSLAIKYPHNQMLSNLVNKVNDLIFRFVFNQKSSEWLLHLALEHYYDEGANFSAKFRDHIASSALLSNSVSLLFAFV